MVRIGFLGNHEFSRYVEDILKIIWFTREPMTIELVPVEQAELLVVAAYGKIIPKKVLDSMKYGGINIHPSLLPKYRGASPVQSTIMNGDSEAGVTIIKMDEKVDHGPIVTQAKLYITNDETFETLGKKLFTLGGELLTKILPDYINEKIELKEQDHGQATHCGLIKKTDGYVHADVKPDEKKIRAYHPWPGVYTIWKGTIVKYLPNQMLQKAGKKPCTLKDFLNGHKDFPIKELS